MHALFVFRDSVSIFFISTNKQKPIFIDFHWVGLNFVSLISRPFFILIIKGTYLSLQGTSSDGLVFMVYFEWKIRILLWFASLGLMNENIVG